MRRRTLAALGFALAGGCGTDGAALEQRAIIGGEIAAAGEFAATGALLFGRTLRCTATLIAPDVVITAAHCLGDEGFGDFGFTLAEDVTGGSTDDTVPVLLTHGHPEFDLEVDSFDVSQRNDVGIVILERPIAGAPIERLLESEPVSLAEGTELAMCGYGRDYWSRAASAGLKRTAVVHVERSSAWELSTFSAEPQPCRGDSGAPLFVDTPSGRRLAAIVSRAAGDSEACDTGAIATRLAPYAEWIADASADRDVGCSTAGGRGLLSLLPALSLFMWYTRKRMRSTALVELGERYAALGLSAAARSVFLRALAGAPADDSTPARRLAELALAAGDPRAARGFAEDAAAREPGPTARLLLARALLAGGQLDAARFLFQTVLEAAELPPLARARALIGRSAVASAEGDEQGAAATAMAATEEVCGWAAAVDRTPADVDGELPLIDEMAARAAATGRGQDALDRIDERAAVRPAAPWQLLRAAVLAARVAQGDRAASAIDVEAALERELAIRPKARAARLRLIESRLRRRYSDSEARAKAVEDLEQLGAELESDERADNVFRAKICFLLAGAYEDDPAGVAKAEAAYERGLTLRPGHAAAANKLALIRLSRGDRSAALAAIERALRIDSAHQLAWRNAARVLDASPSSAAVHEVVARILEAAQPGAGTAAGGVAPSLVAATAEVARGDVLAGMAARGHRLKNLLGIVGARARSARKLAEGELASRLEGIEREVTALYDEWAAYLRSMQAIGPIVEVVPVAPLVAEVLDAARQRAPVALELELDTVGGLADLRGDRLLLREALVNIVTNAVEAAADTGGRVTVRVRQVTSGGSPVIEIRVSDTGPGIAAEDLSRVFAAGFTTKSTGSGLGLAVAERVVVAHHGRISIDSEPGRGTTLVIALPSDLAGFATLAAISSDGGEGA